MRIKPMLGEFALEHIEYIESSERRALVEHAVPGLAGNYFQDMGTVPNTIVIAGTKYGDDARDAFLEGIREIFNAGEPTTFVADINTATDITEVVIEDLQVAEISADPDSFRYLIKLRKYIEPPEPPSTGLLDTGILDDALGLVDALNVIDLLGSLPDLGNPTQPLTQALDQVEAATSGLGGTADSLRALFEQDIPAPPPAPPPAPASGPPAPAGVAPAVPGTPGTNPLTPGEIPGAAPGETIAPPADETSAVSDVTPTAPGETTAVAGASPAASRETAGTTSVPSAPNTTPAAPDQKTITRGLFGMYFETDKTFLLPSAMRSIRLLNRFYEENPGGELLVVGHTDTVGTQQYNLELSKRRAQNMAAYLQDKVEVWTAYYQPQSISDQWGTREDQHMLSALPEDGEPFYVGPVNGIADQNTSQAIKQFQIYSNANRGTGLDADGIAGEETRRELVKAYMDLDGTSLPEGTPLFSQGCGEFHPEVPTGDEIPEARNRRTEVFFFPDKIDPPPPASGCQAPGCLEYPQWRSRATRIVDFTQELTSLQVLVSNETTEEPVPEASVTLTGIASRAAQSDSLGQVLFDQLIPAEYTLLAQKEGFEKAKKQVHVPGELVQTTAFVEGSSGPSLLGAPRPIPMQLAPQVRVEKYKRSGDNTAPAFNYQQNSSGSIFLMDILRGSHSAVTFVNSNGLKIESNNPDNAVPNGSDVFIDLNPSATRRDIFFYGVRFPLTGQASSRQISLFHFGTAKPRPAILQVRVFETGQKHVLIKLYGRSMSLNGQGLRMYRLDVNKSVKDSESPADVLNLVEKEVEKNKPLIHLVINAHGRMTANGGIIRLGQGFDRHNLHLWSKLRNKVKYIWFLNCLIGQDNDLFAAIAHNSQAWVSAYPFGIPVPPAVPADHIEYFYHPTMKHWDGPNVSLSSPVPKKEWLNLFFRSARHRQVGNLNKSLHFNVVPDPKVSYP